MERNGLQRTAKNMFHGHSAVRLDIFQPEDHRHISHIRQKPHQTGHSPVGCGYNRYGQPQRGIKHDEISTGKYPPDIFTVASAPAKPRHFSGILCEFAVDELYFFFQFFQRILEPLYVALDFTEH